MKIINRIYTWFENIILNILGVIRDMINKDNEVKILAMETIRDGIKNIFISRNNRVVLGMIGMGLSGALILSGYIKLPEYEGAIDDEN